jgi:hypothetical protein
VRGAEEQGGHRQVQEGQEQHEPPDEVALREDRTQSRRHFGS